MKSDDVIRVEGKIIKVLPRGMFKVVLDNSIEVIAVESGKMRQNHIWLSIGDRVSIELSPYDLTKGRICYRLRDK